MAENTDTAICPTCRLPREGWRYRQLRLVSSARSVLGEEITNSNSPLAFSWLQDSDVGPGTKAAVTYGSVVPQWHELFGSLGFLGELSNKLTCCDVAKNLGASLDEEKTDG